MPSASTARSACRSWIIATTALTITTARMTIASSRASITQTSPATTHSSSANGWVSWGQVGRPLAALAYRQLVGPDHLQPARGLPRGQPVGPGPQITLQEHDRLTRIDLRFPSGAGGPGWRRGGDTVMASRLTMPRSPPAGPRVLRTRVFDPCLTSPCTRRSRRRPPTVNTSSATVTLTEGRIRSIVAPSPSSQFPWSLGTSGGQRRPRA